MSNDDIFVSRPSRTPVGLIKTTATSAAPAAPESRQAKSAENEPLASAFPSWDLLPANTLLNRRRKSTK